MNNSMVYNFSGTHREVGRQQGEEFRDGIRQFFEELQENVKMRIKAKYDKKLMLDLVRKNWAYSLEYDNPLGDEIVGISEGSGLDLLEIVYINAFLDIVNARDDRSAANMLGCTSFGVHEPATRDKNTYIGQNYDMESFYNKYKVVIRISSPNEPVTLLYTYKGVLGCAGLNSSGIGLCINFLHARDITFGTLYPFRVRKILSQTRIGDAIGCATIGPRAGGVNYLIASSDGLMVSVETTSKEHDILLPSNGILVHTNHFVSQRLTSSDLLLWDSTYDSGISRRGSTIVRYVSAKRILENACGSISLETLKELARDQTNAPFSICCTGLYSDDDLIRGETNASLIYDLKENIMHLCFGIPTASEPYIEIPVLPR